MHEIGIDRATSNAACTSYRILTCLQPVPDRSIFTLIHASEYGAYFPSFSANLGPEFKFQTISILDHSCASRVSVRASVRGGGVDGNRAHQEKRRSQSPVIQTTRYLQRCLCNQLVHQEKMNQRNQKHTKAVRERQSRSRPSSPV